MNLKQHADFYKLIQAKTLKITFAITSFL